MMSMCKFGRLRLLAQATDGVAAVEFAIGAPLLILAMIAMVDTGMMETTRMEMDRNVRAGAQAAMSLNNDPAAIETIVLASAGDPEDLTVAATMTCACSDAPASCSAPCDTGEAPSVFFDISAERPFSGILVSRAIRAESRVQIR
jgi:Flp pilus assembly protein TadG